MAVAKRGIVGSLNRLGRVNVSKVTLSLAGGSIEVGGAEFHIKADDIDLLFTCDEPPYRCLGKTFNLYIVDAATGATVGALELYIMRSHEGSTGKQLKSRMRILDKLLGEAHKQLMTDEDIRAALASIHEISKMGYNVDPFSGFSVAEYDVAGTHRAKVVYGVLFLAHEFKYKDAITVHLFKYGGNVDDEILIRADKWAGGDAEKFRRLAEAIRRRFLQPGMKDKIEADYFMYTVSIGRGSLGAAYSTLAKFLRQLKEVVDEEAEVAARESEQQAA